MKGLSALTTSLLIFISAPVLAQSPDSKQMDQNKATTIAPSSDAGSGPQKMNKGKTSSTDAGTSSGADTDKSKIPAKAGSQSGEKPNAGEAKTK